MSMPQSVSSAIDFIFDFDTIVFDYIRTVEEKTGPLKLLNEIN
jgi:hypothetical protein